MIPLIMHICIYVCVFCLFGYVYVYIRCVVIVCLFMMCSSHCFFNNLNACVFFGGDLDFYFYFYLPCFSGNLVEGVGLLCTLC